MAYNPFTKQSAATTTGRFNQNATGQALPQGTPVKATSSGLGLIDVSVEADVDALMGVLKAASANGTSGQVISSGSIEKFSTPFAVGAALYVSKLGTLTNVKPSIGVNGFGEGDFVVFIGKIAQNADNPADKDLLVLVQVHGQL